MTLRCPVKWDDMGLGIYVGAIVALVMPGLIVIIDHQVALLSWRRRLLKGICSVRSQQWWWDLGSCHSKTKNRHLQGWCSMLLEARPGWIDIAKEPTIWNHQGMHGTSEFHRTWQCYSTEFKECWHADHICRVRTRMNRATNGASLTVSIMLCILKCFIPGRPPAAVAELLKVALSKLAEISFFRCHPLQSSVVNVLLLTFWHQSNQKLRCQERYCSHGMSYPPLIPTVEHSRCDEGRACKDEAEKDGHQNWSNVQEWEQDPLRWEPASDKTDRQQQTQNQKQRKQEHHRQWTQCRNPGAGARKREDCWLVLLVFLSPISQRL